MRRPEYGASWKRITDTTSFPLSKLEHRDLPALLFGGILYILYKWSLFFGENFQTNFRTATVALFRGDSGYRIEKVNSQIGMPISQQDENDPERNNWYCQQCSMTRYSYQVAINITAKGTRNRWSKTLGPINENLTPCLQRYVVPGYESNRNDLFMNINNKMLQIIPMEHNFNFH
jgi:hypothetical protein